MPNQVHPIIEAPAAFDHENFIGSCDWGDCHHPGVAMRWDSNGRQYLTVCRGHANHSRRHDNGDCFDAEAM